MRKFLGCDVLAVLNEIMRHNTESYQEDFNIDKEILTEAAEENDKFDRRFLWMSRPCGTHCLKEKEIFLKDTDANTTWRYYNEQSEDKIIAYAVEIDGFKDGVLKGDLYELDYHESTNYVRRNAVPVVSVKLPTKTEKKYPCRMRTIGERNSTTCITANGNLSPTTNTTITQPIRLQVQIERPLGTMRIGTWKN